jgi:hypothetical protein
MTCPFALSTEQVENTASIGSFVVACTFVTAESCLLSHCLATAVSSGSTVPAFSRRVTVLTKYSTLITLEQCFPNVVQQNGNEGLARKFPYSKMLYIANI